MLSVASRTCLMYQVSLGASFGGGKDQEPCILRSVWIETVIDADLSYGPIGFSLGGVSYLGVLEKV
jgi:hypothetical protein